MNQEVGDTGATLRQHLEVAALTSDAARRDLEGPGLPDGVEWVHAAFVELNSARTSSGFGVNPIAYSEMEAWCRLTGRTLAPWEVDLIRRADATVLASVVPKKDKKKD